MRRGAIVAVLALMFVSCAPSLRNIDEPDERICNIYLPAIFVAALKLPTHERDEALAGVELLEDALCRS